MKYVVIAESDKGIYWDEQFDELEAAQDRLEEMVEDFPGCDVSLVECTGDCDNHNILEFVGAEA